LSFYVTLAPAPGGAEGRKARRLTFYGLADYRLNDFGEVIEFYASRQEANAALEDVLRDEPEWQGELGIISIEFTLSPQ
jgi:hypothetical protein